RRTSPRWRTGSTSTSRRSDSATIMRGAGNGLAGAANRCVWSGAFVPPGAELAFELGGAAKFARLDVVGAPLPVAPVEADQLTTPLHLFAKPPQGAGKRFARPDHDPNCHAGAS